MKTYEAIKYEIKDMVGIIKFDRPKQMNTLNLTMLNELYDAMAEAESDEDVRAVLFTGSEELFGAGADVKELGHGSDNDVNLPIDSVNMTEKLQNLCFTIEKMKKPTIAAIAGYCLGGSLEMAMSCDIRVVSENAKIGLPECHLGALPGAGGTQRLPRLIGPSMAKELLFTSQRITGEEAYRLGLANHVYPAGKLLENALALAVKAAKNAPLAVRLAKQLVNSAMETGIEEGMKLERLAGAANFGTHDGIEGGMAFLEKREPQFTGR